MKVITPGHAYELANFENKGAPAQVLRFINKKSREEMLQIAPDILKYHNVPEDGSLITLHDGTTNEEVLAVLIDRMNYLQNLFPCKENACAITHMQEALMWLEKRTNDRIKRNVEGKHIG